VENPRSHGALVLYHRGLEWIEKSSAEFRGERSKKRLVHQVPFGSIGQQIAAAFHGLDPIFDAYGGGQTAEEEPARLQNSP
jgi:hypothetical protein